jgi:hypothetical protein
MFRRTVCGCAGSFAAASTSAGESMRGLLVKLHKAEEEGSRSPGAPCQGHAAEETSTYLRPNRSPVDRHTRFGNSDHSVVGKRRWTRGPLGGLAPTVAGGTACGGRRTGKGEEQPEARTCGPPTKSGLDGSDGAAFLTQTRSVTPELPVSALDFMTLLGQSRLESPSTVSSAMFPPGETNRGLGREKRGR